MKRSFYDFPALYDAIHLPDTPVEALAAWALIERHHGGARHLLEPGCGTGRFLSYFARRGLTVTGYDTNARALAFARRRLRREAAVIVKSSMTSFRRPNSFDAAYCLIGTFRHLLTERDAIRHLRLTAEALKPGGVYVVGLDLVDYTDCPADEEGWEVRVKNRRLRHLYMTIPPRKRRTSNSCRKSCRARLNCRQTRRPHTVNCERGCSTSTRPATNVNPRCSPSSWWIL